MSIPSTTVIVRRPRWPWLALAVGLAWTALIRAPMIANAVDHLDSDLAVDGLTLLDMVHGRFRWHFPGTPYMGIAPILAALPQALAWGATPATLVSGGGVIWLLVVSSTFWLMWRALGPGPAAWGLLPLVCSSVGTVWLSSRVTGGHLLTLAWHNLAIVGFLGCAGSGKRRGIPILGIWCGLGLYLDPMFLFTLAGLASAAAVAWWAGGRSRRGLSLVVLFLAGVALGIVPREIGRLVDPYDCYPAQFELTLEPRAVLEHWRLLTFRALPRLISGIELPGLGWVTENPFSAIPYVVSLSGRGPRAPGPFAVGSELLSIGLMVFFAVCVSRVIREAIRPRDSAGALAARAATVSALLIIPAFLFNKNVYNSDNYRYLVYLLTPWTMGFGLWFRDLAGRGTARAIVAIALASIFVELATSGLFHWYRDVRAYLDQAGRPIVMDHSSWMELELWNPRDRRQRSVSFSDYSIPADATHVMGSYWDVYLIAFLSAGRMTGVPFPMYPNRFPGWSRGLAPGQGKLIVFSPNRPPSPVPSTPADEPSTFSRRVSSSRGLDWRPALGTLWRAEGRDPAEINRLTIEVP